VKLTKSKKEDNIEKEREVEGKKLKNLKKSMKENSRVRWWIIKEQTMQSNL
jgi:hypothetical protein